MGPGSHVLLEKPPAASLRRVRADRAYGRAHRRACQVGFQDLGSSALPAIARLVADGAIGGPLGICAACAWVAAGALLHPVAVGRPARDRRACRWSTAR